MWKEPLFDEKKRSGESSKGRSIYSDEKSEEVLVPLACETVIKNESPSPPLPLLPPVHPLVGLHQSVAKRKLGEIEIILTKIRSKRIELDLDFTWQTLAGQKTSLKELFTKAEQGIKENRASMSRFLEIIKEETKHQNVLKGEMEFTTKRIKDYKQVEEEFTHYVNRYSMFERYLESVAEVEESWRNVRDILDRFETLQSTSSQCAKILEHELEQAADLRRRMLTMVELQTATLKKLSNRLILLEVKRKEARDKRVYWEHMMQRIKNTILDKVLESTTLKEGINDLYQNMCNRLKVVPRISSSNIEGQVAFIHKSIMFYKEVVIIATGSRNFKLSKGNAADIKVEDLKKTPKEKKPKQISNISSSVKTSTM